MNKKKVFMLGLTCFGVAAIVGTVAVAGGVNLPNMLNAATNEVWSHYDAVPATTSRRGIKEYWISCSTHEIRYSAPAGSATIEDKGAPSESFINKLDVADERIEKQLGHIDFEDSTDLNFFTFTTGTGKIVEDSSATSGTHVLQITANSGGSFKFTLKKEVLDKLFADSTIQSIQFDAKGEADNINFRRRTRLNAGGTDLTNTTYELNQTGRGGLTTEWKTFYFERNFYNQICENVQKNWAMLISDSNPSSGKIYFDNFKVTRKSTHLMQYQGMEGGNFEKISDTDYRLFGYARTSQHDSLFPTSVAGMDVYLTGSDFSAELTTEIVSEGRRALKITHTNTEPSSVSIYLPKEFADNANSKGIMFDVYWDGTGTGRSEINFAAQVGKNIITANHNLYSGCWSTGYLPKDKCTGSGSYFEILKLGGSQCNGVFVIDNIRPYLETEGFEDVGFGLSSSNVEISHNIAPDSQFKMGSNRRDKNDHVFYINGNGATNGEVSSEFYTEGTQSFKYTHSGNDKTFNWYMNKLFFGTNLNAQGVSIDVLTFDGNIKKFCGNQEVVADGQWHTYTIDKDTMHSLRTPTTTNEWYCMAYGSSCSAGTYYFDNLIFLGV